MRKHLGVIASIALLVSSPVFAASFTVGSASATAQGVDPAFKTFTSSLGTALPTTFDLDVVGDTVTFLTERYFTDETSANQPDDPIPFATVLTINFTGPESLSVDLNGTTKGGQFGSEIIPGSGFFFESGLAEFEAEKEIIVGGFKLGIQALTTIYNDQLSGSQTGEAFGANVPVKVTLLELASDDGGPGDDGGPVDDGGPDPTPIPLPAALPIGIVLLAGVFTARHRQRD